MPRRKPLTAALVAVLALGCVPPDLAPPPGGAKVGTASTGKPAGPGDGGGPGNPQFTEATPVPSATPSATPTPAETASPTPTPEPVLPAGDLIGQIDLKGSDLANAKVTAMLLGTGEVVGTATLQGSAFAVPIAAGTPERALLKVVVSKGDLALATVTPLVAGGGGSFVNNNGANFVSNNGANFVNNNGANFVSNNGANFVNNNGAGLVATGGGNYRLAAEGLTGTRVSLGTTVTVVMLNPGLELLGKLVNGSGGGRLPPAVRELTLKAFDGVAAPAEIALPPSTPSRDAVGVLRAPGPTGDGELGTGVATELADRHPALVAAYEQALVDMAAALALADLKLPPMSFAGVTPPDGSPTPRPPSSGGGGSGARPDPDVPASGTVQIVPGTVTDPSEDEGIHRL